jgi:MtN3 and saliva related transmembrane protein
VTEAERVYVTIGGWTMTTALGVAAASWAVLMALSPLLQVREIRRRQSSAGVSTGYLCVLVVGFALWVSYGLARRELPLVIPNSVALLVMAHTIFVALRYRTVPLIARDEADPRWTIATPSDRPVQDRLGDDLPW